MKSALLFPCVVFIHFVVLKPVWCHCKVSQNVECFCDGAATPGGCCRKTGLLVTGLKHYIPDSQITASSYRSAGFEPPKSRINNTVSHGAWLQADGKENQWIQFDLGKPWTIMGFVSKGRSSSSEQQWVKSYEVKYAVTKDDHDACDWNIAVYKTAPELGTTSIFPGNHDRNTPHVNWLLQPIRAQYIRFYPKTFNNYRTLRADIIGCFDYV